MGELDLRDANVGSKEILDESIRFCKMITAPAKNRDIENSIDQGRICASAAERLTRNECTPSKRDLLRSYYRTPVACRRQPYVHSHF